MTRSYLFLAVLLVFATAAQSQDDALKQQIATSRKIAQQVAEAHNALLIKELRFSGPLRSLLVCKYGCPDITSAQSRRTGWKVSMVSLKPRNSALGMADVWEQKVIESFNSRRSKGESADAMEYAEEVQDPQGSYFRYARAIPVEPLCLTCHGARDALPDVVKTQLATDYPYDKATGFSVGQVYGIVSVKAPQ